MTRNSRIEQLQLGERILGCALSGLSNKEILERLNAGVPGHGINRTNLSTRLKAHLVVGKGNPVKAERLQGELLDTKVMTLESFRN